MTVNEIIKQRREALGLSINELARRCKVSRTTVQHWEGGGQAPKRARQPLVAEVLGLSQAELMGTADEMTRAIGELSPRALEVARMFDRITNPELKRIAYATMAAQSSLGGPAARTTTLEAEPAKLPRKALAHKR